LIPPALLVLLAVKAKAIGTAQETPPWLRHAIRVVVGGRFYICFVVVCLAVCTLVYADFLVGDRGQDVAQVVSAW
jgi:ABC-type enterochelin transport system permease subunit